MQDLRHRIIDFLVPLTIEEFSILINVRGNIAAVALTSPDYERVRYMGDKYYESMKMYCKYTVICTHVLHISH